MAQVLPLFPDQASTVAPGVDHLFYFLLAVTAIFTVLIFSLIFYFAVKYHRKSPDEVASAVHEPISLELAWIVIPFLITIVIFLWGTKLYVDQANPPSDAEEIFVVGKQWMWRLQHTEGNQEINELHIPVNRPVKLTMTSQDVIHDFFVPAFRVKKDVVPGRYSSVWFEPTKPGRYHLFCSQYCGTNHAQMGGWVYVMQPPEYETWLSSSSRGVTMVQAGAQLFQKLSCDTCHRDKDTAKGPSLQDVFGTSQRLQGGQTVIADETYLRDSIVNPQAQLVVGYPPIMPTFRGQVSEEQLLQLIAYIRSLGASERTKQ